MATALTIITDAMVEIGAYAPGDTVSSVHQQLGLLRFQNQLDSWQADALTLNLQDRDTFLLTSGTSTFTIGPSGNLVTTRPVFVAGVNYLNPGSSPANEVPMAPMDSDQFMALSIKGLSSSLPQQYYYDAAMPNATMFIWPTVSQNVTLALYLDRGIDIPATITTSVTGPQGYAEAFMYQLALRLCGPMAKPTPPGLAEMAAAAFARMKRPNIDPGLMGIDQALAPTYAGAFNVLTGTFSGSSN